MAFTTQINCPIYDGDGDPRKHWFVCEDIWEANIVADGNRQIEMFTGGLYDRALTCYMNFIKNGPKIKQEIKMNFLKFFQTQDNTHLGAQKINAITKRNGENKIISLFQNFLLLCCVASTRSCHHCCIINYDPCSLKQKDSLIIRRIFRNARVATTTR